MIGKAAVHVLARLGTQHDDCIASSRVPPQGIERDPDCGRTGVTDAIGLNKHGVWHQPEMRRRQRADPSAHLMRHDITGGFDGKAARRCGVATRIEQAVALGSDRGEIMP